MPVCALSHFLQTPFARLPTGMKAAYRTTAGRVPGVVTGGPRQRVGEGGEEEAQCPGDDHVVVEVHVEGDQHHRVADPFNKTQTYNK